jgi:hypothetical protein
VGKLSFGGGSPELDLQDLDALLYYYDTDWHTHDAKPMSPYGDGSDISIILARITLLLIGADACTPRIVHNIWVSSDAARLALGRPRGDLSVIRRRILTHQKVAINMVYIWLTNPSTPVLPRD